MWSRKLKPDPPYGLWFRDIQIEHPPNSGEYERAKPVGMILGGTGDISRDVCTWFPSTVFSFLREKTNVLADGITRRFHFIGPSTKYRIDYIMQEDKVNVAGVRFIPMLEDPFPQKRHGWEYQD